MEKASTSLVRSAIDCVLTSNGCQGRIGLDQPYSAGRKRALMMVYQEKIAAPGPLPVRREPADVLLLRRTIESLEQENTWLKEQLARVTRANK